MKCAPCLHSSSMLSCICSLASPYHHFVACLREDTPFVFILFSTKFPCDMKCLLHALTATLHVSNGALPYFELKLFTSNDKTKLVNKRSKSTKKRPCGRAWKSTLSFLRLNRKAGMVMEQVSVLLSNYLPNCCSSAKPWGARTSRVILNNYISILLWMACRCLHFPKLWP